MNIYIASDHGGFELKGQIIDFLTASVELSNELENLVIHDLGPEELNEQDDYPDYAFKVAEKVSSEPGSTGILICRSGNGMCVAANKVKGAYATLCFSQKHAKKAREDDNSNILCLDADYEDLQNHLEIVKSFLTSKFNTNEPRFQRRFNKIKNYESTH